MPGRYVDLIEKPDGLHIVLTDEGREYLEEQKHQRFSEEMGEVVWDRNMTSILHDLLEDWTCNGWEWIRPEEIGALTAAPIISDSVERDDNGKLVSTGDVWWHARYAVDDELKELLEHGEYVFPKAPKEVHKV